MTPGLMTPGYRWLGWMFGLPGVESVERVEWSLAAGWASRGTAALWLVAGGLLLFGLCLVYYVRFQHRGRLAARVALGLARGLLLTLLLVTLAEPTLLLETVTQEPPRVFLLVDGTESMAIEDPWTPDQQVRLARALGLPEASGDRSWSRRELVQAWLQTTSPGNPLSRLRDEQGCVIEPFLFDGGSTSQLRRLVADEASRDTTDWAALAAQLSTDGQVTALGNVLADIQRQPSAGNLAAVVLLSDFAHNSGPTPLGQAVVERGAGRPAVPVFTVGVGATELIDLAVDLQTDAKIRKGEQTVFRVGLRQSGLSGREVLVRVTAVDEEHPEQAGAAENGSGAPLLVGERTVRLDAATHTVEMEWTPEAAGRFRFQAEVEPLAGETVVENNKAVREANIIDDFVRLMYVAFEPGWEWRFVKEVFHRDKTVGMQGFRTYLASSDPRVRQSNSLFLPTLTPRRSEFFTNDVIFLDDMPGAALNPRFCEMVREFVGQLGGGLVVLAGPRFGPGELAGTPLADMLPVLVDPELDLRDGQEFELRRTQLAEAYPFMKLGKSEAENEAAWKNLGPLPWYQPVAQVHERAEVLAEHPRDTCRDGRTPQPLIAVRRYGEGEVVYLAFNEFWRLRRRYGERYYRDFWSPLIDRLGLSHDLGRRKRFVPRLDRERYRVEETVTLTVQAYDEDYTPLDAEDLETGSLEAQLEVPGPREGSLAGRGLTIPLLRPGVFELRLPVYTPGVYRVRIKDPLTGEFSEREFEVTDLSAERRNVVRDEALQEELARQTGGRSYDLTNAHRLPDDMRLEARRSRVTRNQPLWSTPAWFLLLVVLMFGEWLARKWVRLT